MGYCAKTMRREYRGMLRTLLIDAGMIWLLAAAIGIVTAARHWRDKVPLLVCMALVAIGLAFWGCIWSRATKNGCCAIRRSGCN